MRRVQVLFPESLDDAAKREAARRGVSKGELIRDSVAASVRHAPLSLDEAWEAMIGWVNHEPVEDVDEVLYGPIR